MANTEETTENVIPVTDNVSFVVKEEVCSETDSPPVSPVHKKLNNVHENSEVNASTETDLNEKKSQTSLEETDLNEDSGSLKIDEENTHVTSDNDDDKPVDYSQKSSKTASKSKKDSAKNDKPMQLFMNGFNIGLQGIQFSGGILYQPTDQSRLISPFVQHHADGKQMRPFKAYNAKRDILTGMPLAGYAVPIGGKVNEASAIPFRINNKNKSLSQESTNGTQSSSPSTHLMTLATEADKLRQRENGLVTNQNENTPSEDGLNSDGNDSYKDDINEFYPQGLHDVEKKKGKKRKNSMEDQMKDDTYWERRRKNNEAAKRSRDARRAKEDQIAIRAALLEQENMRLRIELAALKEEMIKLRSTVYGKNGKPS